MQKQESPTLYEAPAIMARHGLTLPVLIYSAIAASLVSVLLADFMTDLGVAVWVFYVVPLILALFTWRPATPFYVALAATVFMVASFYTDAAGGVTRSIAQGNRLMGLFNIWALALVAHIFIRNKLIIRHEEWLKQGQTELSDLVLGEQSSNELGTNILRFFMKYLGAQAGVFYIQQGGVFERVAISGVPEGGALESFMPNDGLLGQAVREKKTLIVTDVPDGYIRIGSALGESSPRHVIIAPGHVDNISNSVIELGFLRKPPAGAEELLKRMAESLGIAIRSAEYRTNLQDLLEETQRQAEELQAQAEELQAQAEELRVANEELEEQGRALQESQSRLEQQQAELEQTNAQLEEQTQQLEAQKDELERAKEDLELRKRDVEQASQYKSDFLANMSHELRTPLNSSLILAKLLADNTEGNLSEEQVRHAETIQAAGNDLLLMINDILDLSKIEAGHMEVQSERIRLSEVMSNMERAFEPQAKRKNLGFTVNMEAGCPDVIESDSKRLEQVLKNLLSNALKFTEKGEVQLILHRLKGSIAFTVKDTGIGIAPDQQEIIFEAFRQADGTTNRKYGGTGLGLSISRKLAHLLGGELLLESEPGKGSSFTIAIPEKFSGQTHQPASKPAAPKINRKPVSSKPQPAPALPPRPERMHSVDDDRDKLEGKKHVLLVVEDDEAFARILYGLSHELDFQCLVAMTADEALDLALRYIPSAVILDVGLPDYSGLSVLDRLKQDYRTRHIPVHVISGHDYSQTALSMGAIDYMLKPVKRETLISSLKTLESKLTQNMHRVLVVEDDQRQMESLKKLLGTEGVETVGAGTAAECLELLKNGTFDCMVLDLSLPDASGYSLLETLSSEDKYSFPPVIVYTGRELTSAEEQELRRYSKSIIIKGAKSPERLLDEVTLFLHQVVADLPPEQQRLLKKAKSRDSVLEGRRILVVEDDIRNLYSITSILEPRGAFVQLARNGREALEMLDKVQKNPETAIDLVLMDVMMPEMDGLTATRAIRQRKDCDKLPILMLTAKAMKDDQEQCINAGANDYMAKPLDVEKLLSLVRVWLPR